MELCSRARFKDFRMTKNAQQWWLKRSQIWHRNLAIVLDVISEISLSTNWLSNDPRIVGLSEKLAHSTIELSNKLLVIILCLQQSGSGKFTYDYWLNFVEWCFLCCAHAIVTMDTATMLKKYWKLAAQTISETLHLLTFWQPILIF